MSKSPQHIEVVSAETVEAKAVEYAWRNRIPAGMVTLIAGRPGQGKSMLTSLLASDVSNEGHGVIFANAEDPIDKITVPRLQAAGAKMENVKIIGDGEAFDFPSDVSVLRSFIYSYAAKLVILDPIASHMGVSLFNDQEARKAMKPLSALAAETGAAIIAIAHLNKATGKNAHPLSAIGGSSGGVVGASRAVYIFGPDPEDANMRVLAPAKVNFGPSSTSVAFDMEETEWILGEGARATTIRTGKLQFLSDTHKAQAKDILSDSKGSGEVSAEKKAVAAEWLTGMLALGPVPVAQVREEAASNGVSWATLRRAADEVGVVKQRHGFGPGSHITWELPTGHPAIALATAAGTPGPIQGHGGNRPMLSAAPATGEDEGEQIDGQMDVEEIIDLILAEQGEAPADESTDDGEAGA